MPFYDFISLNQANPYETAALPGSGDVNAGAGGVTTSSLTNENDLAAYDLDTYSQSNAGAKYADGSAIYDANTGAKVGHALTPKLSGTSADHPFITLVLLAIILFAFRKWGKKDVTISNVGLVTAEAMFGFLISKFVFGTINVASISPTVEFV